MGASEPQSLRIDFDPNFNSKQWLETFEQFIETDEIRYNGKVH